MEAALSDSRHKSAGLPVDSATDALEVVEQSPHYGHMASLPVPGSEDVDRTYGSASIRRIGFLLSDGVKLLDVVGTGEVFIEANQAVPGYEVVLLSADGSDVVTSFGSRIEVHAAAYDVVDLDTVIVPGSELSPDMYVTDELVAAARFLSLRVRRIASTCSGAFVLAAAGVLRNRRVVTHWKFTRLLAQRYPDIDVQQDALFLRDHNVYTSAGAAAGMDLALALVEDDYDSAVARRVSQYLLVYMQRSGGQSQFSVYLRTPVPHTPIVREVTEHIKRNPGRLLTVVALARAVNVSPRHLTRLFSDELDMSPARFVATIRFDCAVTLLEQGATVADAAQQSGFGSVDALRRAFSNRLGISPSTYQKRFRTVSPVDPEADAPDTPQNRAQDDEAGLVLQSR